MRAGPTPDAAIAATMCLSPAPHILVIISEYHSVPKAGPGSPKKNPKPGTRYQQKPRHLEENRISLEARVLHQA